MSPANTVPGKWLRRLAWPAAAALLLALSVCAPAAQPSAYGPSAMTQANPAAAGATSAKAAATATATATEEVPLPKSPIPPFAKADTNNDGKIEWSEAQAVKVPKKLFDQFDFDKNGSLSETEWLFVRLHMTDFTPPKTTTAAPAAATRKR